MTSSDSSAITPKTVAEHGLSSTEFERIKEILGRAPNLVELGIFSVMWSEHCSYKSSRRHLAKFPTKAPWVVQGPGENAGVVDIGDGQVVVFKMESHNHPSYIEPYQGAATGVGGIMRDIFTMGARPVAVLDALRFGEPRHPKTRHLISGVVAGIGGYGNCVGVPTVGGECTFHASFNGNILVNAMCVGIAHADKVFYARAAGVGNPVVYVGAKTGRDGIHGATMASAEFTDETEAKRPTVQVGDPFTEKLLIEACLELMARDCIVAIQDMGAAGLTSSSFEMAASGGTGIEMDLDQVPLRETGMTAYEIMLSESQERMLIVLKAGHEDEARAIFEKWELDFATVGHVTDTGRMVLRMGGEVVADLPVAPVSGASPVYDRPTLPSPKLLPIMGVTGAPPMDVREAALKLLGSPDIASKRWLYEQYDHLVRGDTVQRPGGDAAVVRVDGSKKGLALTTDCTPRYCEADPFQGGMQAVAEAWRNLIAVGARPLAITNCLNFGNPERPRIMGQLVACIEGMAEACRVLDFPVVSGNVSLYNETDGRPIQPTPNVGGVGLIDDLARMTGLALPGEGFVILMVGESAGWLGASLYMREVMGREEGAPPPVDLTYEKRNGLFVQGLIHDGLVAAVHDIADGGLTIAIAEMCLAGGIGATLEVPDDATSPQGWLFGEEQGRYVLAVKPEQVANLRSRGNEAGVLVREIGRSGGDALNLGGHVPISLDEMRRVHEAFLPDLMQAA
ncbi:phosphoribosylformylglycinamidine synthase subunit II [Arboricoccus pini]|uniref:Phosphoribosylformylglycinamidine synthase subunit PurL n=1 Tax=Arboricoccus pini TaxID=1963835 RepID=A0A212R6P3_9PROT|nr:phosphoribosylformylglycinamidine synthase subunit PurL [Arboricoccus pini]SNB67861.1 phosphoribosylformylglycinamidine synthase subunit II [Arboricoccus pini]